ncbi:hypothetical protein SeMB42_g06405 [Synchytrium endobioticum]|uniref:Alpha-tubulin N-acetyltransferase n=1 Tax=Synchytrium endobioticum TaxID=286115 RepID=A0A507CI27_9FUNG|nr:hypothetical protein SeMB42_g06405 [Synchytrium endobioticum]TPX42638.1 hypothetical protein SeLEV6574_g05494 [Synchytrium endobioticum]
MNFSFDVNTCLASAGTRLRLDETDCLDPTSTIGVSCLAADYLPPSSASTSLQNLDLLLECLGNASALAQKLHIAVTSLQKLSQNPGHRIYVMTAHERTSATCSRTSSAASVASITSVKRQRGDSTRPNAPMQLNQRVRVVGMIKIGMKHLFLSDTNGCLQKTTPLCVLDFYVHESCQRKGYGKLLFDVMLKHERTHATQLAIDRPSQKMMAFLSRHYFNDFLFQANKYVISRQFFPPQLKSSAVSSANSSKSVSSVSSTERLRWHQPSIFPSITTPGLNNVQASRNIINITTPSVLHTLTRNDVSHSNGQWTNQGKT